MKTPFRLLGVFLVLVSIGYFVGAGVAYSKTQDGYGSLSAFSNAQNVTLSYNEDGELIDRGTTEGADAIMELLTEDWDFPVVMGSGGIDANDPVVNSQSEYMYQMATIVYHVLHGTQTVVLEETVEYNGETFEAGTYEVEVDGRYWTEFDRMHPLEGPARSQAWSGTVHALVAELGVGAVTHSALQLALGIAGLLAGLGVVTGAIGGTFLWVGFRKDEEKAVEETADA